MTNPLEFIKKNDIIYIYINSPDKSVNVFTRVMANQLIDFFESLKPDDAKLIVFQSTKPFSFLNGAELLLTGCIKDQEDLSYFKRRTRTAYDKVFRSPDPTLAAVQGNCFGCGVEFILCCDYRVASETHDTYFYLTELEDYLLLPLFGSIEKLPNMIGINRTASLLINGEKWRGEKAYKEGIIDKVIPIETFSADLKTYIHKLIEDGPVKQFSPLSGKYQTISLADKCPSPTMENQITEYISSLPPSMHKLYFKCWENIKISATKDPLSVSIEESEKNTFISMTSQAARNAAAYFFINSMATAASLGVGTRIPNNKVNILLPTKINNPFCEILIKRKIQGLYLDYAEKANAEIGFFNAIYLVNQQDNKPIPIEICWEYQENPTTENEVLLYFPDPLDTEICEVYSNLKKNDILKPFLISLIHLGWQPVMIYKGRTSPINLLINSYMEYIDRFNSTQEQMTKLNTALWNFGWERLPCQIGDIIGTKTTEKFDNSISKDNQMSFDLLNQLYKVSKFILQEKILKNSSQIDLLMRSVFGFPLDKGNFTKYMQSQNLGEDN